jgi:hypothetical protein
MNNGFQIGSRLAIGKHPLGQSFPIQLSISLYHFLPEPADDGAVHASAGLLESTHYSIGLPNRNV